MDPDDIFLLENGDALSLTEETAIKTAKAGARLRQLREDNKLPQKEAASRLDASARARASAFSNAAFSIGI